jgi:hypothetical protein
MGELILTVLAGAFIISLVEAFWRPLEWIRVPASMGIISLILPFLAPGKALIWVFIATLAGSFVLLYILSLLSPTPQVTRGSSNLPKRIPPL